MMLCPLKTNSLCTYVSIQMQQCSYSGSYSMHVTTVGGFPRPSIIQDYHYCLAIQGRDTVNAIASHKFSKVSMLTNIAEELCYNSKNN